MNFDSGAELLDLCREYQIPVSEVMKQRELQHGAVSEEVFEQKMIEIMEIMSNSAHRPLSDVKKSIGGLIGGEASRLKNYSENHQELCGKVLSLAMVYAMAVLECNASMGLIVAAPTAGSSGVVPGVLLAMKEALELGREEFRKGLLNASAIGYLAMRNSSVAGAEAGCQAEVGVASAMAASAAVELMGGTPEMCLQAASLCLSNLLGLVCDPVGGFVEDPCQSRNVIGVANALTCAQLALSGITHVNSFDDMLAVMLKVGSSLPSELRETAMGGNAIGKTACERCKGRK